MCPHVPAYGADRYYDYHKRTSQEISILIFDKKFVPIERLRTRERVAHLYF